MLPERVLEELVRRVPMREHLITEAWPDLSTESNEPLVLLDVEPTGGSYQVIKAEQMSDLRQIAMKQEGRRREIAAKLGITVPQLLMAMSRAS